MSKFLLRRLALTIPTLLLVSLLALLMTAFIPGDPARVAAGEFASDAQVEQVRAQMRLDESLFDRYTSFISDSLRGDFGESVAVNRGQSVGAMIMDAVPATISLALFAIVFAVLVGVPAGMIAALRRDTLVDRTVTGAVSIAFAVPTFVLAPVLVTIFAIRNPWLPAIGYSDFSDGPWEWFKHLVVPGIALGIGVAAELARQTRGSLVDQLDSSYIRTARAKGLRQRRIVCMHAMKNAAIPVVTVLGLQIGRVLGGAVVIESIVAMPGLGTLTVKSISSRDFPLVQAMVLLTATTVVVTNLLVDASFAYFNPRLRK